MDTAYILNPNYLGEELRDQIFVRANKRDLGGFNTFVLQPEFLMLQTTDQLFEEIADIIVRIIPTQGDKANLLSKTSFTKPEYYRALSEVRESLKVYACEDTLVAWYWAGEAILFFAHDGKAVINLDCRKESGWQWVSW